MLILGVPVRGLQVLFFMVILAWVTTKIAPVDGFMAAMPVVC